jgi:EF-hand domain pair/EF hand
MAEFVKDLVRKFDSNSDGFLSIGELTDGLKKIGIFLTSNEVHALMRKLDLNRDGEVSADEILTVLGGSAQGSSTDQLIQKMLNGAKSFSSLKDYTKYLIKKFDRDNDGIITFTELCDGLQKINIIANSNDRKALMERLDIDRDGKITEHELYRVLSGEVSNDIID